MISSLECHFAYSVSLAASLPSYTHAFQLMRAKKVQSHLYCFMETDACQWVTICRKFIIPYYLHAYTFHLFRSTVTSFIAYAHFILGAGVWNTHTHLCKCVNIRTNIWISYIRYKSSLTDYGCVASFATVHWTGRKKLPWRTHAHM